MTSPALVEFRDLRATNLRIVQPFCDALAAEKITQRPRSCHPRYAQDCSAGPGQRARDRFAQAGGQVVIGRPSLSIFECFLPDAAIQTGAIYV